MNYLKSIISLMALSVIFLISSCAVEDSVEPATNLSEFEKMDEFWTEDELPELVRTGAIGLNAELALVPLIFDENEKLLTPHAFNSREEKDIVAKYTDLSTFEEVTGIVNLKQYAQVISLDASIALFVYDPYASEQMTIQEQRDFIEKKKDKIVRKKLDFNGDSNQLELRTSYYAPSEYPNFIYEADIVTGWHPTNNSLSWAGHAGVVHTTNGNPHSNVTENMEALGYSDDIALVQFNDYWINDDFDWQVLVWDPTSTDAERSDVVSFLDNESSDPYGISSKNNWTKWYCSKLAWRAYKSNMGCDLDYNGGFWVTPAEIAITALNQTTDAVAFNYYLN